MKKKRGGKKPILNLRDVIKKDTPSSTHINLLSNPNERSEKETNNRLLCISYTRILLINIYQLKMKVISAALLLIASASLSEAFAPTSSRAISSFNTAPAAIMTPRLSTPLFMAFESTDEIELDCEERMEKSVSNVKQNLTTIRTGRATTSILDLVQVDYYGAPTPLNQVANVSVPNSQQLAVSPYDKSTLVVIEKAIIESGLGLTPNNDGDMIRINIPSVTEERRKELLKQCKAIGEDGKVAIRNIRRDGVEAAKKMEKAGDISEDEAKGTQDNVQKLTDQYVKSIDEVVGKKEKEVMTV